MDCTGNGEEALSYLAMGSYDCIILDIMLPGKDGLSVLQAMRAKGDATPVLLLTARDSVEDRVKGLDSGADDYLVKPFSNDELSARIRALLRRRTDNKSNVLEFSDLKMDLIKREVSRADKSISLSAKEFSLLEYMMRNPDRVLTRAQMIEHVWNFDFDSDTNIINVYIRYLRGKIDKDHEIKLIHTVHGSGYMLREGV